VIPRLDHIHEALLHGFLSALVAFCCGARARQKPRLGFLKDYGDLHTSGAVFEVAEKPARQYVST
jgi:hypothetical protein